MTNKFTELRKIDVAKHIEKKNGLSYLSWAWAVDQLLQQDASATWTYSEPLRFGDSLMVFCSVTAFNKTMTAQLPVMDHKNKAIINPDSFQVNVAMQRCLAKAIALHGIGLYIYAGEDLPDQGAADVTADAIETLSKEQIADISKLATEVGVDIGKIIAAAKVESVEQIQSVDYQPIINRLNLTKEKATA